YRVRIIEPIVTLADVIDDIHPPSLHINNLKLKGKSYRQNSLHKGICTIIGTIRGNLKKPKSEYSGIRGAILCNVLLSRTPTPAVSPAAARWKHLERRSADKKEDEISICLFPPLSSPSLSAIIQ
ncbi:MAG TPA: hypothetical protein VE732_01360, partial [Nitrososphaera sp.]|nr:hypothetical protein [Nitrososphaera sp.]